MLRRQQRLRREYLFRKAVEDQKRLVEDRKQRIKDALETNTPIQNDLRHGALSLNRVLEFDDEGGEQVTSHEDDEYR